MVILGRKMQGAASFSDFLTYLISGIVIHVLIALVYPFSHILAVKQANT